MLSPFVERNTASLPPDARVIEAAQMMRDQAVGSILILDQEKKLLGIITEHDLVTRVLAENASPEEKLSRYLTSKAVSIQESASLSEALSLMETNGLRRLPVVRDEQCIGIVTLGLLIASGAANPEQSRKNVQSLIRNRERTVLALKSA